MYVIGITGGVGSGKSYAAHRLQKKLGLTGKRFNALQIDFT